MSGLLRFKRKIHIYVKIISVNYIPVTVPVTFLLPFNIVEMHQHELENKSAS